MNFIILSASNWPWAIPLSVGFPFTETYINPSLSVFHPFGTLTTELDDEDDDDDDDDEDDDSVAGFIIGDASEGDGDGDDDDDDDDDDDEDGFSIGIGNSGVSILWLVYYYIILLYNSDIKYI